MVKCPKCGDDIPEGDEKVVIVDGHEILSPCGKCCAAIKEQMESFPKPERRRRWNEK
jgi:hypothetical protein